MDCHELLSIAGRSAVVYLYLLVMLRFGGRRPVASFSSLDLILALAIGEIASRPVRGQAPLAAAIIVIAALTSVHYLASCLSCTSLWLAGLMAGSPRILVRNGEVSPRALAAERIGERDLRAMLRTQNVERLDEVKLATLEPNGHLTVVKTERARPLCRADLQTVLLAVQREVAQ
jgi:uncharacterized membrane protein YcaP (DUF421 family)